MFASNCPVSLPIPIPGAREERDMGGMSWSDETGLFYAVEDSPPPFRKPSDFGR